MFLRTVKARGYEYVQLVHNRRDPETRVTKAQVLYSFGRKDQLDLDAIRRLIQSLSRFLPPDEVDRLQQKLGVEWPFEFLGARDVGGAWFLDQLWRRLGIDRVLRKLLAERAYQTPVERLLFALVANRALDPSSKLAMEPWVRKEVLIDGLEEVEVHQLYRAMDFLLEAAEPIQREVFWAVADLFNLEVDLVFFGALCQGPSCGKPVAWSATCA